MYFYSVPFNNIYVVQLLVNILHISVTYLCNKRLKNTSFNCTTCYKAITCCSVAQWCLILCDPMNCSTPGFPVLHHLPEFAQTHVHWAGDAIQLSRLCHPLLLPSIFPSIMVFSKDSVLCIRWPKYRSFSYSISLSNEYSRLISLRWTGWVSL